MLIVESIAQMSNLRDLPSALAKKAALELNENPADTPYFLNALREWVEQQPHLKSRTCDQFLIAFLRASKFSLEKAKNKLENFYTYRSLMPDLFTGRYNFIKEEKTQAIVKSGCLVHLAEPIAPDGPRVVMIRANQFDMQIHSIMDVFRVGSMYTDFLLYEDDNAIVSGYVLIMDLGDLKKDVVLSFQPSFARDLVILANKCSPSRMRGFHFLKVPTIFETCFNMVKSVISAKLRERFYVHGRNYENLYEHVPKHILPKEYGGECDMQSLQEKTWIC
ncbi:alpha-tocopherol transfer protein-like [Teleopsis dalmanni]|uniref:alpha-tocopherol transfer protein-like n=1 Tax=Teleopsis dalmanni TaxID=139649 RepID=UPI0018CE6764|nr:alpha-tocopherol transfer protein-like [Teleopsis dalmanni]